MVSEGTCVLLAFFAHGTSNGASFYEMKIGKMNAIEPHHSKAVEGAAPRQYVDLMGRRVVPATRGFIVAGDNRKMIKR